jgi:hypothetical protein
MKKKRTKLKMISRHTNSVWTSDAVDACILSMQRNRGLSAGEIAKELQGLGVTLEQIQERLRELKFIDEL